MSDFSLPNYKAKYEILFSTFGGNFSIAVRNLEGDKSKHKSINVDKDGLSILEGFCKTLATSPPETTKVLIMRTKDQESNSWKTDTIVGIEKTANGVYNVFIDTKIAGEMKKYTATMSLSQKWSLTSGDESEKERSEYKFKSFCKYISEVPSELQLAGLEKDAYYAKLNMNQLLEKNGLQPKAPQKKQFAGGGNKFGGNKSFNKPMSQKVQSEDYIPAGDIDDMMNF